MTNYEVQPIGTIRNNENGTFIEIHPKYIPAMKAMEGFSHIQVIWWFSDFDDQKAREILDTPKPYTKSPDVMGIFATRSPIRPNPIGLTPVEVLDIDHKKGLITIAYIDANDNTPVLDLKPYTPSFDRIDNPKVPDWCSHWPKSLEASACFEWEKEFNWMQ